MADVEITMSESGRAFVRARAAAVRRKVTLDVHRDARRYAPVDTTELRESISADPEAGTVTVTADHWAAQEYGAQPHTIPNAFGREGAVQHPGNAAQPYMRPALYTRRRDLT